MRQQFSAGYAYRQMYGEVVGLNYSHDAVVVRSTDSDRTLVSAMSQLAGWFPQTTSPFPTDFPVSAPLWLPIPVHTVPTANDSLLRAFDPGSCPTYTAWMNTLGSTPSYAAKNAEVAPSVVCTAVNLTSTCTVGQFITRVGILTGIPNLTLASEWKVSDTLFVRLQHNLSVFDWATANNNAVINYLDDLESWGMYSMCAHETPGVLR